MTNERFTDLIEIMALHEEAISEYYSAAAERFPKNDLWSYLSKEEQRHAMWLRSILDNVIDGSVNFTADGLSFESYMASISKISAEKTDIAEKRRKLSQVFEFAVNIENDMLEKNFLDGFTSPSKGIQVTLEKLQKETEEHRQMLKKSFDEYKKQKQKYLEDQKKKAEKPVTKKLSELKTDQDEIQNYLEDNDCEWIEQYKKIISKISEDHARLKRLSESSDREITSFEDEKEKIAVRISREINIPEEPTVEFVIYHYIGLHAEYERQLSNLYKLFENIFPNDELWPFMAEEERKHECWLKEILLKMKDGTIDFKKPSYNPEIVLKAVINISEIIHYCKEFKITHEEAYHISTDQENSMLEDGFFGKFSSDAPAIENVFKLLIEDTIEHRNWLKRRMEFYNY